MPAAKRAKTRKKKNVKFSEDRATKVTKAKTVPLQKNVVFPETSHNPNEWRCEARKVENDAPNFYGRTPGKKGLGIRSEEPAVSIYLKMMSNALEILLKETNRHGAQRAADGDIEYKWKDVTKQELLAFLGLLFAMGGAVKKDYK